MLNKFDPDHPINNKFTVMRTSAQTEITNHYDTKSSQVYMRMFDLTNAFDNVELVNVFELLIKRDISDIL